MTTAITTSEVRDLVREDLRMAPSLRTLERWADAGAIPTAAKRAGRWYFERAAVAEFVAAHTVIIESIGGRQHVECSAAWVAA